MAIPDDQIDPSNDRKLHRPDAKVENVGRQKMPIPHGRYFHNEKRPEARERLSPKKRWASEKFEWARDRSYPNPEHIDEDTNKSMYVSPAEEDPMYSSFSKDNVFAPPVLPKRSTNIQKEVHSVSGQTKISMLSSISSVPHKKSRKKPCGRDASSIASTVRSSHRNSKVAVRESPGRIKIESTELYNSLFS